MNVMLQRGAKVVGFPIAAVALALLAEFLFSLGMAPVDDLPDADLVSQDLGTVMAPIDPEELGDPEEFGDTGIRTVWPVQRDGATTAVVVVASAPGYRSRIDVAVTVEADGTVRATHVGAQNESSYARRAVENSGADALSGATLTERGIRSATETAVIAAQDYFEEQR
ncbi:MAG: FMN-binding protein [Alkalispirochaeta sp.]